MHQNMTAKTCIEKVIMNKNVFYLFLLQLSDLNSRKYNHIKIKKKGLTLSISYFGKEELMKIN